MAPIESTFSSTVRPATASERNATSITANVRARTTSSTIGVACSRFEVKSTSLAVSPPTATEAPSIEPSVVGTSESRSASTAAAPDSVLLKATGATTLRPSAENHGASVPAANTSGRAVTACSNASTWRARSAS